MDSIIQVECTDCDYYEEMTPDEKPVECPRCGGQVLAK